MVTRAQDQLTGLHKNVPVFILKASPEGVVEAIVSVMGIIDLGGDIIHKGAYVKTISERAGKIRVLDNHQTYSVRNAIARPLLLREISRDELPDPIVNEFPMATGGLYTSSQFMLDDEDSYAVFKRIENNFINEYSIGFDIVKHEWGRTKNDEGVDVMVRNIRELRLYEYSPVLWGMNQATATETVKQESITLRVKGTPPDHYQDAPAAAARRCGSCRFYKTENDNSGHCEKFDFTCMASYVCNDYKPGEGMDKGRKEYTAEGPQKRLGDVVKGSVYDNYMALCNQYYKDGYLADYEHRAMCEQGMKLLDTIAAGMNEDIAMRPLVNMFDLLFFGHEGGEEQKANVQRAKAYLEGKSGRVLSASNEGLLQQAAELIEQVLSAVRKEPEANTPDASSEEAESSAKDTHLEERKRLELELALLEAELGGI